MSIINHPGDGNYPPRPSIRRRLTFDAGELIVGLILVIAVGYGLYFWLVRRVVVGTDQVLVLLRKDGSRSLPNDQVIVPSPPPPGDPAYAQWEKQYGDCNGILEQD